jgi:5-methylcytosine-specific restriction endonuclease McrA
MKTCRKCGEAKVVSDFYPNRGACKACVLARVLTNPNRQANGRRYHQAHKVRINAARVERQRGEDGSRQARYKKNHPEKHADVQARRRATKVGNGSERYDRRDIYVRDGGVCQLCDEVIDLSLSYPDPWSFSIDHVRPIARGGPDTPANVQSSHLRCNIRKGLLVGVGE